MLKKDLEPFVKKEVDRFFNSCLTAKRFKGSVLDLIKDLVCVSVVSHIEKTELPWKLRYQSRADMKCIVNTLIKGVISAMHKRMI